VRQFYIVKLPYQLIPVPDPALREFLDFSFSLHARTKPVTASHPHIKATTNNVYNMIPENICANVNVVITAIVSLES